LAVPDFGLGISAAALLHGGVEEHTAIEPWNRHRRFETFDDQN
jgi:hypothetical protein